MEIRVNCKWITICFVPNLAVIRSDSDYKFYGSNALDV